MSLRYFWQSYFWSDEHVPGKKRKYWVIDRTTGDIVPGSTTESRKVIERRVEKLNAGKAAALPLAAQPEGKPVRHERWCAIRMWDPISGKPCPDCNCAALPERKKI